MGFELTKFDKLDKDYKKLLGRKSTLMRMIQKRNKELLPLVKEVKKLKNEIEGFEEELDSLKSKIKEISIGEKWEPPIVITKVKNIKGYDYLRGKIRFGNKEKVKMIPKKTELAFLKKIKSEPKNKNITEKELKNVLYGLLRRWVLEWWRTKGILEKK
jgi:vacuolar-type H+-ATPase subunit I/STV1